jgi:hypothetical protein
MGNKPLIRICVILFFSFLIIGAAVTSYGEPAGRNIVEMKFVTVPGLPTCSIGSIQSGDPMKELLSSSPKLTLGVRYHGIGIRLMNT